MIPLSKHCSSALLFVFSCVSILDAGEKTAPEATIEKLAGGFVFTEGPAVDGQGNVWFSDDPIFIDKAGGRIYRRNGKDGTVSLFIDGSNHANGMTFDRHGKLVVCEGGSGCLAAYDTDGNRTVLASEYGGKRFNMPNDLWIDPRGGIYFTDPVYTKKLAVVQAGEDVYYLFPDQSKVLKVADGLVRPNGLVGTSDGKTLYLTDRAACKIWRYDIMDDGTLSGKTLFADVGADGMAIDDDGNIYLAARRLDQPSCKEIVALNSSGLEIIRAEFPELPTNLCRDEKNRGVFFVTAGKSLYRLRIKGL